MKKPDDDRWLIVFAVMLVAVIEVLDLTIVNVALPQMMGDLSANIDEITWVLTSYIVSSAIVMLLTGFFTNLLGRKRLLLINIGGFMIASALCGISQNLTQIVFFRICQGVFGASLVPLSQYILRDTFSREEQGFAMAIWGAGIMAAPVLGPTLGGYITEYFNWRWIFYINIPICAAAFFMIMNVVKETPPRKFKIDWWGLGLMIVGIGCLQLVLDRGNTDDWFQSIHIVLLTITSVIALTFFIYHCLVEKHSIIDLRIFADRNFGISTLLLLIFGAGIFGTLAVQPLMLQELMNYPIINASLVMAPRGLASAITMLVVGKQLQKYDPRIFVSCGIIISAYGTYLMSNFYLDVNEYVMLVSMIIQGVGMGLFFVPISTLAFNTLDQNKVAEGTGLFSFGRSMGSSIGISILGTILSWQSQANWNHLASNIYSYNRNLITWLQHAHMNIQHVKTIPVIARVMQQQAQMVAFVDVYWFVTLSYIVMLPLLLLLRKAKDGNAVVEGVH